MSDFTTWRSLVDGEEVSLISDSVEYRFVADDYDEGQGEWDAIEGDATLVDVGSPTKNEDDLNGLATITLDGSDDGFVIENDADVSLNQPFGVVTLLEHDGGSDEAIIEGSDERIIVAADAYGSRSGAGIFASDWVDGGLTPDNEFYIQSGIFDGADSAVRVNKSTDATGDPGNNNLGGLTVGVRDRLDDNFLGGKIAEIHLLSDPDDVAESEDFIEDRYGLSLD